MILEEFNLNEQASNNEEFEKLFNYYRDTRYALSDEFVIREALKMYCALPPDKFELKIRLLELLKDTEL
nr:hypothetical protein [Clostridium sp. Marseille-P7770]